MTDPDQTAIPPAFARLHADPRTGRPLLARAELASRHEFCDDLAQTLALQAPTRRFELGVTEDDVLERFARGLRADAGLLSAPEAGWVIGRVAELLDWPVPGWVERPPEAAARTARR